MNKYKIHYGSGIAEFWCYQDRETAIREFSKCANACFGIRKSITIDPIVMSAYENAALPIPYREKGITHLLCHSGDEIAFDANFKQGHEYWKIKSEWDDWCSCAERGICDSSCNIHQAYADWPEPE